jgi:hypothetical protein
MSEAPQSAALRAVQQRVAGVARRVALLHGLRASAWGLGAAALSLSLVCLLADPVLTPATARALRALVLLCGLGAVLFALRPALQRRGAARAAFWIGRLDASLGSRTRSALELGPGLPAGMSPVLFSAHVEALAQDLSRVPPSRVVPWSTLRQRDLAVAVGALLLGLLVLQLSPRARLGAHALFNPARIDAQGVREAAVVDSLSAKLTFPGYLQRPAATVDELGVLSAPVGTTLDLRATLRIAGEDVVVQLGPQQVRLARGDGDAYSGRLVVRETAALALRVSNDGAWYQDVVPRKVEAQVDAAPLAELSAPSDGARVRADESVVVQFRAVDDLALDQVELVIRLPSGSEQRRRLWSAVSVDTLTPELSKSDAFVPERIGAAPGDALLVWIEARDGDVVSGPKLGRSNAVRVEVASSAQQAALQIPPLREVLDQAIALLADRLEQPPPEAASEGPRLHAALRARTDAWLAELAAIVLNLREQPGEPLVDLDELRGMVDRNRALIQREAPLYTTPGSAGSQGPRQALDAKIVDEQETDVLALSDMLAAALVDEANQLTADLKALREHIKQLLEQLKNSKSPEARQALLAEIQRAQERLQALARSLSAVATQVPSEFINQEALEQGEARSSMEDLREAVMSDDLDAAAKHLEDLAEQVERLAQDLKEGSVRFGESRNGARNGALSEAQRKLSMIAQEQERLASRSRDTMREATERAGGPGQQKIDELGKQADQLASQLDQLSEASPMGPDGRGLDRARDRLRDARDALRTGDLSEARRMALEGERDLDSASRDLANDARMFPGHQGETAKRAEAASAALGKLQRLQQALDRATPRLDQHLDANDRRQLSDDARPQHDARDATQQLAEQLRQGPDGRPLSDTGALGLEEAQQAMAEAERALKQGDVQGANAAQEAASGQLRQLAQDLKRKRSRQPGQRGEPGESGEPGSTRPGEDGQQSADGTQQSHEEVHIPGAEEFVSPTELRRRLLDAMRESAPSGFESANERYYRELLR